MKSMSRYLLAVFVIWIVNTLPVVASDWEKVSGDELKAAVNNKQWKNVDFSFHWRSDGKRFHVTKRGGNRVEKWWIEKDETTICYKNKKFGTRCCNLEKKGDKYRMVVTKSVENRGKIWKVSIKDGIADF